MKIFITSSTGSGNTELSAFDKALFNGGVANTNLIILSSIIPPDPEIIIEKPKILESEYGKRLYVVLAQNRTSEVNQKISAGIGWVVEKNSRFGLFVEHQGGSKQEVEQLIKSSLTDMIMSRSEYLFSEIKMCVEEVTCTNKPVCVLCCAVYKLENW